MIVTRDTPHLDIPFTRNIVPKLEEKCVSYICVRMYVYIYIYRGADKSLARPGRKSSYSDRRF